MSSRYLYQLPLYKNCISFENEPVDGSVWTWLHLYCAANKEPMAETTNEAHAHLASFTRSQRENTYSRIDKNLFVFQILQIYIEWRFF